MTVDSANSLVVNVVDIFHIVPKVLALLLVTSFVFNFFPRLDFTMSVEQEVDDIVQVVPADLQSQQDDTVVEALNLAVSEVSTLLKGTEYSFMDICTDVEQATSSDDCRRAFRQFNKVVRMILLAAPGGGHHLNIKDALHVLEPSEQFSNLLEVHDTITEAITA